MLTTVIIVLLILFLFGGLAPWPGPVAPGAAPYHGYGYGWPIGGALGAILLILIVLALLGHLG